MSNRDTKAVVYKIENGYLLEVVDEQRSVRTYKASDKNGLLSVLDPVLPNMISEYESDQVLLKKVIEGD